MFLQIFQLLVLVSHKTIEWSQIKIVLWSRDVQEDLTMLAIIKFSTIEQLPSVNELTICLVGIFTKVFSIFVIEMKSN